MSKSKYYRAGWEHGVEVAKDQINDSIEKKSIIEAAKESSLGEYFGDWQDHYHQFAGGYLEYGMTDSQLDMYEEGLYDGWINTVEIFLDDMGIDY